MITRYDELFCHQAVSTFDRPGTSAREWTERSWLQVHNKSGTAHLATGFGYYPNRNVMDAFVCYTKGATEYVVRASRELRPDIDVMKVGPFSYEVVEPLKKVRYLLDDNDYGLTFDIEIEGYSPAHEEGAQHQISRGRLKEDIKRFVQPGKPAGWIKADGRVDEVNGNEWAGERDRSWGIRVAGADFVEQGVQPMEIFDGQLFNFVLMQFKDWGASFHIREVFDDKLGEARTWHFSGGLFYPYGSDKEEVDLTSVRHEYEFRKENPDMRQLKAGKVYLTAFDGTTKEVSIKPLTICYQGPGGYGLYWRDFIHGVWKGPFWMDGHKLDLSDPQTLKEVWGYVDYGSEFQCEGQVGYGTTELIVVGKYPRYGYMSY